jgi:hypothetical protein
MEKPAWAGAAAPGAAWARTALGIAIGAASLAAAVAACSSSPAAAPAPSSAAASASASAAPAALPTPSVNGATGPDVCSALPAAEVASATGHEVENVVGSQIIGTNACTYQLRVDPSQAFIQVQVAQPGSAASYASFTAVVTAGANPKGSAIAVPGIGQQATGSSAGMAVRTARHDILILNQGSAAGSLSADAQLAKILASHFG